MKHKWLVLLAVLATLMLCSAQTEKKTFIEFEGCSSEPSGAGAACFYFIQDKETGTRCYAYRSMYHDGAAISCVKQ